MSRPPKGDRLTARGRPKRRAAAKANIFKYQLAADPSRVEENDLKRALQESLEEQMSSDTSNVIKSPSSKRARLDRRHQTHKTASSPEVTIIETIPATPGKRTRLSVGTSNGHHHQQNNTTTTTTNNNNKNKCDANLNSLITLDSPPSLLKTPDSTNRSIRTYSRSHLSNEVDSQQTIYNNKNNKSQAPHNCLKSSFSSPIPGALPSKARSTTPTDSKTTTNGHEPPNKTKSLTTQPSVSRSTQTPASKPTVSNPTSNKQSSYSGSATNAHNKSDSSAEKNSPHTKDNGTTTSPIANGIESPVQDQYLKSKRESKNYAYVKMTALKVSTEKFPSSHSRNSNSKKASPKGILNNSSANKDSLKASQQKARDNSNGNHTSTITNLNVSNSSKNGNESKKLQKEDEKSQLKYDTAACKKFNTVVSPKSLANHGSTVAKGVNRTSSHLDESGIEYDCPSVGTNLDLSNDRDPSQTSVNVIHKRNPEGSWSLLGIPEEKVLYVRDDEPPRRLICYPAIKHVEGDVIQVRDSVLLRSGARKTDLPYIAKVCAFWEDAETGGVMMSLFWYYRPEHTEDGRKPHHLMDEIFASRHRDVDSVECIEDKCYVLTFNEYCRYRKRCKMEQVNKTWSLTDVTIPMSNESYPRRNRIPDSDVNPELVFCCRQVYDSRMKRLLKNPLINPKYGHI